MTLWQIMTAWRQALLGDAALDAWSTGYAGRGVCVLLGVAPRTLPSVERDTPFVALQPMAGKEGQELAQQSGTLRLVLGLRDLHAPAVGRDQPTPLELPGLEELLERFLPLTLAALTGVRGGPVLAAMDFEVEVGEYPLIELFATVTVTRTRAIGARR